MSELRTCPLTGRKALLAPERSGRPGLPGAPPPRPESDPDCPFCPGRESRTPPARFESAGPDGWQLRVVPNRFPAAAGHEVLVESRHHRDGLEDQSPEHAALVVAAIRDRIREALVLGATWVTAFKNQGRMAGATLDHPHWQIIPQRRAPALEGDPGSRADWVRQELEDGSRVIEAREGLVLVAAPAPRVPFEAWIVPGGGTEPVERWSDGVAAGIGRALRRLVRAARAATGLDAHNVILVRAWSGSGWRLEVLPRRTSPAGFEMGTGIGIVEIAPESAAPELRTRLEPERP